MLHRLQHAVETPIPAAHFALIALDSRSFPTYLLGLSFHSVRTGATARRAAAKDRFGRFGRFSTAWGSGWEIRSNRRNWFCRRRQPPAKGIWPRLDFRLNGCSAVKRGVDEGVSNAPAPGSA